MSKSTVGPAVTELRTQKAWAIDDLAEKARVKVTTVRALEQGARVPRHGTIRKIAKALGVTPEILNERAAALEDVVGEPLLRQRVLVSDDAPVHRNGGPQRALRIAGDERVPPTKLAAIGEDAIGAGGRRIRRSLRALDDAPKVEFIGGSVI